MEQVCQSDEECGDDPSATGTSGIDDEVLAQEKVINAFLFYKKYGQEKIFDMRKQLRRIPPEHHALIAERREEHCKEVELRLEHNYSIIRMIVNFGVSMFGEESMKAMRIHQSRRPSVDFMSKVLSTIRQICREWSSEGAPEREMTFTPIMAELNELFPDRLTRHEVRILLPGCGLGRLAYDLVAEGYTVQGNEFSLFMLMTSCFMLNASKETNQFTMYPFIFDKSNSWDYEDQLRPITFPDNCPTGTQDTRKNSFSMCAGDFLDVTRDATFDVIVTAWFIDTAHNVLQYIDTICDALEPNGIWINVGPLTYHFEDVKDETSIELPYSEVMRLIRAKGFTVTTERRIDSRYTGNRRSMLQNTFTCAFFSARKGQE